MPDTLGVADTRSADASGAALLLLEREAGHREAAGVPDSCLARAPAIVALDRACLKTSLQIKPRFIYRIRFKHQAKHRNAGHRLGARFAPICLAGENAAPPEDVMLSQKD